MIGGGQDKQEGRVSLFPCNSDVMTKHAEFEHGFAIDVPVLAVRSGQDACEVPGVRGLKVPLLATNQMCCSCHLGVEPKIVFFFTPQIIPCLIGFSIIFTIHFGVPLFLETPICD